MFQQFTPLAARLIVEEDDMAPLPPPPEDDAELDYNEDPLFSAEGALELSWETDYRRFELAQSFDISQSPELGAWTVGSDRLVLFGRGVEDREPRSITMSLGGQRMTLRLASCGEASTILVEAHDVWEWGKHVSTGFVPRHPTRLQPLCGRHITSVSCGAHHSIALSAQDEVWVWGEGSHGQLGLGNWEECSSPTPLKALSGQNIIGIGCGQWHSIAFAGGGGSSGNTLWTWGNNEHGQLGHSGDRLKGWRRRCNEPTEVAVLSGSGVVAVAAGAKHSMALLQADEVWSWGTNDFGQLGVSGINDWPLCSPISPTRRCFLPRCIEELSGMGVVQVSCGSLHSVALTNSGAVLGWGRLHTQVHSPLALIEHLSATRPQPSLLVQPDGAEESNAAQSVTDSVVAVSSSSVDIFAATRSGRLLMLKGRPLPMDEILTTPSPPLPPPPLPPPPPGIRPAVSSDELARTVMAYRAVSEEGNAAEQTVSDSETESGADEETLLMDDCGPMSRTNLKIAARLFQHRNLNCGYDDWLVELNEEDSEDTVQVWEEIAQCPQDETTSSHEWSEVDLGQGRGLVLSSDGCGAAHSVCFSGVSPCRTRSSLATDLGALLSLNSCFDGKHDQSGDVEILLGRQDEIDLKWPWLGDLDCIGGIAIHHSLIAMRLPGIEPILEASERRVDDAGISKVVLPSVSHSVLVCLVGWAYTGKLPIRKVCAQFEADDLACRWLLDVAATSKRLEAHRVEWLCTFELYHRLNFPKIDLCGGGEARSALVVDILLIAEALEMIYLKKVAISLIADHFKAIVSDHALFVVARLSASSSYSNDLLAMLLQLGDNSCFLSLSACPPDALDVSMLGLFRQTSVNDEVDQVEPIDEVKQGQIGPDVIISFSSGLKFTAHSSVLSARSRFFEKALYYHSPDSGAMYRLSIVEDDLINPPAPEPAAFVAFLRFLYTGSTRPVEPTHALYLLQVLDYFDLRSALEADKLSRACHAAIIKKVDDTSALPLLKSSHRLGLPRIRELAFNHVLAHASGCLGDKSNGEPLETLCSEMPELASALIWALVEERDNTRASNRHLSQEPGIDSD